MGWGEAALWWLPTAMVAVMAALAIAAVLVQPQRAARLCWIAGVLVAGATALAVSARRQETSWVAYGDEAAQLRAIGARLDALGRMLPAGPGKTADETFDTAAAALHALNHKIKDLEGQIDALHRKARDRAIVPKKAEEIADYLRGFGSHRVVVSVAPDDVEAYTYANQIANLLRAAGWDALGPEATTIFGEAPAMAVRLYVYSGTAEPDTAKILGNAFTRFNIPFEPGIAPSDSTPKAATTELFVSHKP
jgi:hypothetical protein